MNKSEPTDITYDIPLLKADMARKGWLAQDLSREANVSHMTVSRFLRGERQTARAAKKLAVALGFQVKRYIRTREAVSA